MTEMLLDAVDAIENAARGASDVDTATQAQTFGDAVKDAKSDPHQDASYPNSKPSEHKSEGGIAGLWDSAVSSVSHAYDAVNGAVHTAGHALDNLAQDGINITTDAVHDVAGNSAANAFHTVAEGVRQNVKDAVGFSYGLDEGAAEAVGGMVKGVGDLVGDGYKFATDGTFRGQVVQGAENLASRVAQDPLGTAKAVGEGVWHAGQNWVNGAEQAAKNGDLGEYVGKGVGNLAVNVGGFFIPGADAADGLNLATKAGEATELLGDTGKASEFGRAMETGEDTGRLAESSGSLNTTERAAGDAASDAGSVKRFTSFKDFEEAANHPEPNTTYSYGSYTWKTDAQGRTIEASGEVHVQEFGRNNPSLQAQIGHEGKDTDVGFHLVADSFDGPTVRLNVVPGNGKPIADGLPNLNQGAYKQFENEIRDLASVPGNKVEIMVEPRYSAGNTTNRPDQFIASYRVNGGDWNTRKLLNK